MSRVATFLGVAAVAVIALALPWLIGPGLRGALLQWSLLAVLATSWNWIGGLAGRLALTQHSFVGVGGYFTGIAVVSLGLHPILGIGAAILLCIALTGLIAASSVSLGIRDLYFALLTVAVAEILLGLFHGVENGWFLGGIPFPLVDDPWSLFFRDRNAYYFVYLFLLIACLVLQAQFTYSRGARVLSALRDDELAVTSFGQKPFRWLWGAYAAASIVAVIAGGVSAQEQLAARTDGLFDFNLMILVLTSAVLGGLGSLFGGVVGAAVVVVLDQLVIAFSLDSVDGASTVIHGGLLLVSIFLLPRGLVGAFAKRAVGQLHGAQPVAADDAATPAIAAASTERGRVMLAANDVTVRFGGNLVIDGVSVEARAGEITGIIGPNGAGKTTLFNAITGLVRPRKGTIVLGGADITRHAPPERARLGIFRTFQLPKLFGSLDVAANVDIGWMARSFSRDTSPPNAHDALNMLGIAHLSGSPVATLTTGQRRLVELARAIAANPRVLMVDEVFAGLTSDESERVMRALRFCKQRGTAVVMIEHILPAIRALVDHLYVLDQGRILAAGTPSNLLEMPDVRAAYLGVAA